MTTDVTSELRDRGVSLAKDDSNTLVWMAATAGPQEVIFPMLARPLVPAGWSLIDYGPTSVVDSLACELAGGYSILFEATWNHQLGYDPVVLARALSALAPRPRTAVAIVSPTLAVSAETQHALAFEVGQALGVAIRVVSQALGQSPQTASKEKKQDTSSEKEPPSALQLAMDAILGRQVGEPIDSLASAVAYAYTTTQRRRDPFRCTPLQRRILQVVAAGEIVSSTGGIAASIGYAEKKVSESIAELVDALGVPRAEGKPSGRDSHARLSWLMQRFILWIRLVDQRQP